MRKFSKLAPLRSLAYSYRVSSMLLFCWYFVVYSAIPQVIKVNCIDCICIYRCVLMCLCICVTLADFFPFFVFKTNYADSVSVYVMLYVIILIQILIRYNVKISLLHAPANAILTSKLKNLPTLGHPPPRPSPRSVASLPRICHFFHSAPPPQCVDPRCATGWVCQTSHR